jgi:hypothetical protein
VASVLSGLARDPATLIAARFLQWPMASTDFGATGRQTSRPARAR